MADGDGNVWVAVLSVLATGGLAALAAAIIAFIKGWSANRRVNEKSTVARQGELLDRYEKHAAEERRINEHLYLTIKDCCEDRARWEEWGTSMEMWAKHQADLCRRRGEDPSPVPPAPPRKQRVPLADVDFERRTSAQTGVALKALADKVKDGGRATPGEAGGGRGAP